MLNQRLEEPRDLFLCFCWKTSWHRLFRRDNERIGSLQSHVVRYSNHVRDSGMLAQTALDGRLRIFHTLASHAASAGLSFNGLPRTLILTLIMSLGRSHCTDESLLELFFLLFFGDSNVARGQPTIPKRGFICLAILEIVVFLFRARQKQLARFVEGLHGHRAVNILFKSQFL